MRPQTRRRFFDLGDKAFPVPHVGDEPVAQPLARRYLGRDWDGTAWNAGSAATRRGKSWCSAADGRSRRSRGRPRVRRPRRPARYRAGRTQRTAPRGRSVK